MKKNSLKNIGKRLKEMRNTNKCTDEKVIVKIDKGYLRAKYYPTFRWEISQIFAYLDKLREIGDSEYFNYIASIESRIDRDYAETFPYETLSRSELEQNEEALKDLELEAMGMLYQCQKKQAQGYDLEIGRASLAAVGADSVNDLDDAVLRLKEERNAQDEAKRNYFASALSATKDSKGRLSDIVKKAMAKDGLSDTDEGTDAEGVNPKGE